MNPLPTLRLLALAGGILSCSALAHGKAAAVNLRGAVLCLDSTSVQLRFEGLSAAQQRPLAALRDTLNRVLVQAFQAAHVRYETRASCQKSPAFTRVLVEVRYLNPKTYVGFGDPAYAYTLRLEVGTAGATVGAVSSKNAAIQFASAWSDIHSEGSTKKSLAETLTALGQEQARDLAHAWQHGNP
ncbi:MAG: hypothetical protein AB1511_10000 [Deinococcota bacterium]